MRLSTSSISSLLAVSLLGLMVLSPSNAQTSSNPKDGNSALSPSARALSIRAS